MFSLSDFWHRLTLGGRLLLLTSLILVLTGSGLFYASFKRDVEESQTSLKLLLDTQLQSLSHDFKDAFATRDRSRLQEVVDGFWSHEEITGIRLQDAAGKTLITRERNRPLSVPFWFAEGLGFEELSASRELQSEGGRYGTLTLSLGVESRLRHIWLQLQSHLFILLLGGGLNLLGVWWVLRQGLQPLQGLDQASRDLAGGDLGARIPLRGSPEVRRSIRAFNRMATAIEKARNNLTLEKKRFEIGEARLSAVIRGFPNAVIMEDDRRRILLVNQGCCDLFECSAPPEYLIGADRAAIMDMAAERFEDPEAFRQRMAALLGSGEAVMDEVCRMRDGRILERDFLPMRLDGRFLGSLWIYRDISARTRTEAEIRLAASVFETAQEAILITDNGARIIKVNRFFTRITGYRTEEVLGQNPRLLQSGKHHPDFYQAMWRAIRENGYWSGEVWNRRKDGQIFPARLTITAVSDADGGISHYVGISNDISVFKQHEQELVRIAHYDALTGLPNRILLADRMQQAIAHARRSGHLLAVGYLDLDGFKQVNDDYGHEAGDALLVEVARRLTGALRGEDTVARLGGDEFVFLLGLERIEDCESALGRILEVLSAPVDLFPQRLSLSASIGVSLFPTGDMDPDILLRHADQAMYQAKQSGKNRYSFYEPGQAMWYVTQRQAQDRFQQALEEDELCLYVQPKINMRSGEVLGVEALIRWQHPEQGLLPPQSFLPGIENTQLETALDLWVLQSTLEQMESWHRQGIELAVSVNVLIKSLQQANFCNRLNRLLGFHTSFPPGRLQLELRESSVLSDLYRVAAIVESCRKQGFRVALDNFGTGYASLSCLKLLPVDTVKIDSSFVRGLLADSRDLAIVEAVIALTRTFGCEVIANGVETLEHARQLLRLGCEIGQGRAFVDAIPANSLETWLADWHPDGLWERENLPEEVAERPPILSE